MRNIGQIEHDHLVSYVATTEYDDLPGVVMPWLSTFNLCSYLPNTYVPVSRKLVLVCVLLLAGYGEETDISIASTNCQRPVPSYVSHIHTIL